MDATIIKKRIDEYRQFRGYSVHKFEQTLNLSVGYWNRTEKVSAYMVGCLLETFPELSAEWVFRGEGNMLKSSTAGTNVVVSGNSILANNVNGNITNSQPTHKDIINDSDELPVLPPFAANEQNIDVMNYVRTNRIQTLPMVKNFPSFNMWFAMSNDAMYPYIQVGELTALKLVPGKEIINGDVYAINTKSRGTLIRIVNYQNSTYTLKAVNSSRYEDMQLNADDILNVFKVVGTIKTSI